MWLRFGLRLDIKGQSSAVGAIHRLNQQSEGNNVGETNNMPNDYSTTASGQAGLTDLRNDRDGWLVWDCFNRLRKELKERKPALSAS